MDPYFVFPDKTCFDAQKHCMRRFTRAEGTYKLARAPVTGREADGLHERADAPASRWPEPATRINDTR